MIGNKGSRAVGNERRSWLHYSWAKSFFGDIIPVIPRHLFRNTPVAAHAGISRLCLPHDSTVPDTVDFVILLRFDSFSILSVCMKRC